MIKTLYEQFQRWSEKGSVFITSDPHFVDYDMNWRIRDVPIFMNLPEDEESVARTIAYHIVDTINSVCHKNDTLIVLGDIGDVEWMTKLKAGHRVLIAGNHDVGMSKYKNIPYDNGCEEGWGLCFEQYCKDCSKCHPTEAKHYFDEVYDGPLFIAKNIVLSHEPLPPGPYFNIHGHEHYDKSDEWLDALAGIKMSDYYLNTCCEHNAFVPMNLGKMIKDKGLGKFIDIHRVTIDEATKNSFEKKL